MRLFCEPEDRIKEREDENERMGSEQKKKGVLPKLY